MQFTDVGNPIFVRCGECGILLHFSPRNTHLACPCYSYSYSPYPSYVAGAMALGRCKEYTQYLSAEERATHDREGVRDSTQIP